MSDESRRRDAARTDARRASSPPEDVAERFFARQRAEVMARVAAAETRRRRRRAALPAAAAILVGAALVGGYALRGTPRPPETATLAVWEQVAETATEDPLSPFDPIAVERTSNDDDARFESDLLLPTLDEPDATSDEPEA